jgi:hypothetical protein
LTGVKDLPMILFRQILTKMTIIQLQLVIKANCKVAVHDSGFEELL